ncbi:MAG TPA: metallophosphoesterase [Pyrinomonadaceae bacterium]|nr:metallophosphoesterase [Pyrinomonadaceae bacterium]
MTGAFVVTVAVLGGLLLFLVHELRRPIHVSKWDRSPLWRKRLRVTLATVLLLLVGIVGWAFFIGPNRLVVRHETVQINNWPTDLSNLKIAVLSDIHIGSAFIDEKKVRYIVEQTNQLQPDMIVILGDYIAGNGRTSHRVEPEVFGPMLKGFRAPLGVYSVLGNHDWWYDGLKVRAALEANGIKVLENEAFRIEIRGKPVSLVGLADLWTRQQRIQNTIATVPEGDTIIALTHNPDIFPQVPQRVPLLLAGHTHGGQVTFPFIGPVVESSEFGNRYVRGHIVENGHHLFVTTGIGTSIVPVRFGVPPEIVLLTIQRAS